MNLGILSLIALLLAIVIGFLRNANVGVLCLGFTMILGLSFGIPSGKLLAGFSSSIFMQMVGITFLFGIVKVNGTLELLAKKLLGLVGKRVHLIPVVFFIIGAILQRYRSRLNTMSGNNSCDCDSCGSLCGTQSNNCRNNR